MSANALVPSLQCPTPVLQAGAQGIDRVAVDNTNAKLTVVFLAPIVLPAQNFLLSPGSYTLTGGQRLFPRILRADFPPPTSPPSPNSSVALTLDAIGDFSIYTLTVSGPGLDPFFSSRKLRFRLGCDDRFDCSQPAAPSPAVAKVPVTIDYMAKDFASFRQALLDFIPTRMPDWTERSEADIGMMLLELFAATADNLSYLQDRVANEAFLGTATQRRSVAAHLALIGYQMDEGAAAHTWLQFQVGSQPALPSDFSVSNKAGAGEAQIFFEPLGKATLDPALNQMALYNWGNQNCCLPASAVSAALVGQFSQLSAGDYLLFDDGQGHRDVVRLTAAPQITTIGAPSSPPASSPPAVNSVTVVSWSPSTPLRTNYCVSQTVVRGNLIPATHGLSTSEDLRNLKPAEIAQVNSEIAGTPPGQARPRQRLTLSQAPLAHLDAETYGLGNGLTPLPDPSTAQFITRPAQSVSTLQVTVDGVVWNQQATLLDSQSDDQVYRVEIDDDGSATVVFGDGAFGAAPPETSVVTANYRVGGGGTGNVGADTLVAAWSAASMPWLLSVTNPVAATGGRDLESGDHARRIGPASFHQPLVAVTASDYESAAEEFSTLGGGAAIQRANANFQWTGSWLTVRLAADPLNAEGLAGSLQQQLLQFLGARRLTGYDLEVVGPKYVPVELAIQASIVAGAQQGDVEQALLNAFGSFFNPNNFTFGADLYIGRIYAAAMAVAGVASAEITLLARLHSAQPGQETAVNLAQGFLAVGDDEIIRLDNDPNFPQNGTLSVVATGGNT
jgi:hypothetical protein